MAMEKKVSFVLLMIMSSISPVTIYIIYLSYLRLLHTCSLRSDNMTEYKLHKHARKHVPIRSQLYGL